MSTSESPSPTAAAVDGTPSPTGAAVGGSSGSSGSSRNEALEAEVATLRDLVQRWGLNNTEPRRLGVITSVSSTSGFIDGNIYFDFGAIVGTAASALPSVGTSVLFSSTQPQNWNNPVATFVEILVPLDKEKKERPEIEGKTETLKRHKASSSEGSDHDEGGSGMCTASKTQKID